MNTKIPTVEQMRTHFDTLCTTHSVTVTYRRAGGRAWRRTRRVSVAPVKSAVTYAVALHELGHVLGKSPTRRLDREVTAWQWAKQHAIEWTPRMEDTLQASLDSYARWFLRKRRRGINVAPSAAFDLLRGEALTMAIP